MDYVARTGFGTVSKNVVKELKKYFDDELELHIIAINYFGVPYFEDDRTYVVSAKLDDVQNDDYGRYQFLKTLSDNNFDGVFICQDLGVISPIIEVIKSIKKTKKEKNQKNFKSIFYFPVDCHIFPELTKDLEFFDLLCTYTHFAKDEIVKLRPDLKTSIKVVPHGNNSKDFYPLDFIEVMKFRREYFGNNSDKFIVTNVNRNQPRKDIPNTIFGFIEAKKTWDKGLPKPFLYLHCHPADPLGWDLKRILSQTELVENEDYMLLPEEYQHSMVEIEMLNKIYNASDVYLTTTLGEGWGLTYSEAASCKVPIIAPYITSFVEMSNMGRSAYMLYNIYPCSQQTDSIIREQTDIMEIAETLHKVAINVIAKPESHQKKIESNYEWAKNLEWSNVCKIWIKYFKETF
jgi:glycosyltransferase involved in cell wall biosynthesis